MDDSAEHQSGVARCVSSQVTNLTGGTTLPPPDPRVLWPEVVYLSEQIINSAARPPLTTTLIFAVFQSVKV